ncbi:MAG TPA: SulP family inorganic anion transporter, partial [Gammaproteobacteria bacterium]|nr:SulP family inorganic anion transporter [Gammaproteobacteria bacterium]
ALAFTVVMLGGVFQIAMGFLKLGKYIELVPHPVVSGFMTGIGVIIILLQFGPLVGQPADSKPLAAAQSLPHYISQMDTSSLLLSIITLVVVYGVPKFLPRVNNLAPSPLLALVVGTLIYLFFMPAGSTPVIGDIPTGFPEFRYPTIELDLTLKMIASGLTLAGLGAIDSLLTSLVADNVTRTQHKSDRELIGQGIGNTIAGMFGGLPGAGATMRTVVNVKAGGRTPISGALHAIVLLTIVLGAGSLASDIPDAVLAGILIKVGTDIIDWDYLKRLKNAPKSGVVIMFTVLIITVTVDLLLAVGVGMVMASFLFMKRMTDIQISSMKTVTDPKTPEAEALLSEEEAGIMQQAEAQIMLFHMSGPMSFSSAKSLVRRHASIAGYKVMLLDLSDVHSIDFTTSRAMEDIITDTISAGRHILLVGACTGVHNMLEQQGVLRYLEQDAIHQKRIDALQHAQKLLDS